MKYQPLYDRVLVEPVQSDGAHGKILIPDTAKEKPTEGIVVMVGEGNKNDKGDVIPLKVKNGDTIVYTKWAGTEIKLDGKDYVVIKESDILLVKR
ncbi:chaperonin 10 Kd subunit [Orientia chuto str. Dubai]|uniref:Co-chaperonin GroES n=1 Tax=Orientia chuto str. Dubai TaxID=1359168 RepID=A0A0F3MKL1_9RICK|nr:co-chaperone GroES [Candidatus Orientia mediorientalis]KJV56012.1 chaperonin 10 Kd subunit [Orientia chuto str. Dubai]